MQCQLLYHLIFITLRNRYLNFLLKIRIIDNDIKPLVLNCTSFDFQGYFLATLAMPHIMFLYYEIIKLILIRNKELK